MPTAQFPPLSIGDIHSSTTMGDSLLTWGMTGYVSSPSLQAESSYGYCSKAGVWGHLGCTCSLTCHWWADAVQSSQWPCWREWYEDSQRGGDHALIASAYKQIPRLQIAPTSGKLPCATPGRKQACCTCLLNSKEKMRREKWAFMENAQRPCT